MKQNHQRFLQHLSESDPAVWVTAEWLRDLGYTVSIPPGSRAKEHKDWKAHADNGDLHILQRVEVKRLGVNFTCAADWPFGSKFIVCAKHSYDRAKPKPYAYIILSTDMAHVAVVKSDSSAYWQTEKRKDSRYDDVSQKFYFCPIEHVRFLRVCKRKGEA